MTEFAARLDGGRGRLRAAAVRVDDTTVRPFFTPKTLAAYLDISERTVRQMVADQRIASYKVEGMRRIDRADVEAYLARNRVERR